MRNVPRLHEALLAVAALASMVACLAAVFAWSIPAAALAMAAAALILGAIAAERRRDSPTHESLVRKAAQHAEAGRKLVIYERTTGLFAHWYISLRGEEECNRAARYEHPLTLLLVEPAPDSNVWAIQGQLANWLRSHLRAVDVAGYLGNGRYVVLMPETDIATAQNVVARLHQQIDHTQPGIAAFPEDGVTFQQLYAVAGDRLGQAAERAA